MGGAAGMLFTMQDSLFSLSSPPDLRCVRGTALHDRTMHLLLRVPGVVVEQRVPVPTRHRLPRRPIYPICPRAARQQMQQQGKSL